MRTTLALLLAVAASSALTASRPPELPVATFFEVPAMSDLEFSPDGSKILATIPYERRANLMVVDLEKKSRNLITNFKDKSALIPITFRNETLARSASVYLIPQPASAD